LDVVGNWTDFIGQKILLSRVIGPRRNSET